jgi:hypothetical protein
MVAIAAATLVVTIIRLWIGRKAEKGRPRRVAALRGRFVGDDTERNHSDTLTVYHNPFEAVNAIARVWLTPLTGD